MADFPHKLEAGAAFVVDTMYSWDGGELVRVRTGCAAGLGIDYSMFDQDLYLLGQYLYNGPRLLERGTLPHTNYLYAMAALPFRRLHQRLPVRPGWPRRQLPRTGTRRRTRTVPGLHRAPEPPHGRSIRGTPFVGISCRNGEDPVLERLIPPPLRSATGEPRLDLRLARTGPFRL
ncbi:MAG: hypothetical protein MZU95_07830 [Desulfomicrobium escambiense]|nr:hypothetical protein [Desulfomicrobium escambiense]